MYNIDMDLVGSLGIGAVVGWMVGRFVPGRYLWRLLLAVGLLLVVGLLLAIELLLVPGRLLAVKLLGQPWVTVDVTPR